MKGQSVIIVGLALFFGIAILLSQTSQMGSNEPMKECCEAQGVTYGEITYGVFQNTGVVCSTPEADKICRGSSP